MQYSPFRWYFCTITLFVLGGLIYVWCHVTTLSQGEQITALREKRESLIRAQDRLKVQVAALQKASRIREIAANELEMQFPDERPNNLYTAPASGLMGRSVSLRTVSVQSGSSGHAGR